MKHVYTINLNTEPDADFTRVEQEARRLARRFGSRLTLLAWWDEANRSGGPRPACAEETLNCVTKYAENHDAACRIRVNGGEYELFYGAPSADFEELDESMVREVHRSLEHASVDNLQGG